MNKKYIGALLILAILIGVISGYLPYAIYRVWKFTHNPIDSGREEVVIIDWISDFDGPCRELAFVNTITSSFKKHVFTIGCAERVMRRKKCIVGQDIQRLNFLKDKMILEEVGKRSYRLGIEEYGFFRFDVFSNDGHVSNVIIAGPFDVLK